MKNSRRYSWDPIDYSARSEQSLSLCPSSPAIQPLQVSDLDLTAWSLLDEKARMVVDREGKLLACCDTARQLLGSDEILELNQGFIRPKNREFILEFEKLLMSPTGGIRNLMIPHEAKNDTDEGYWIIRATDRDPSTVFLLFKDGSFTIEPRFLDIGSLFGLTPSEDRLVRDLSKGLSLGQIADKRGVSKHTLRAHLRHTYEKLDLNGREQFWRLLMAFQI